MTSMHVVRPDDAGGVLVDAEAEQARVLGDEAEQPAEPVPLLEVLVDDDARAAPRGPAAIWAIRCLGVAPDAPNAIMWLLIADAPALVPGDHGPRAEAVEDRVGQARAADRRREPELVAAGQEHAGRVAHGEGRVSSLAWARVTAWSGRTLRDAELAETRACSARPPRGRATRRSR